MKKNNRTFLALPKLAGKNYLLLIGILLSVSSVASAHKKQTINPSDVVIEGKILDSNIVNLPGGKAELTVLVSKYPFYSNLMQQADHKLYRLSVKNGESFKFVVPALANRFYLFLDYRPGDGSDNFNSFFDNVYILEKGDRLSCELSGKMFRFSGKGAAKLNCQSNVYAVKMKEGDEDVKIMQAQGWPKIYEIHERLLDSMLMVRKQIVRRYSHQMGSEMTSIMMANLVGMRYFQNIFQARVMAGETKRYKAYLNSNEYKTLDQRSQMSTDDKFLVAAPLHTVILFEKIMMQTRIVAEGMIEQNFSVRHMKNVFEVIRSQPPGLTRNKLLGLFFAQWQEQPSIYDFADQGLALLTDNYYRDIISKLKSDRQKAVAFYPFQLEDDNGKTVSLEDLKDKVVLVDFWFTGCNGCAVLKRMMEGVWKTYKDNPKVRFVSIAIDRDKDQWKKSILSKVYTEPEAINLYTGGLGTTHPIIKALEINSYPVRYLLNKGKVVTNIPYPSGPDTTKGGTKELIDLIEKQLEN